jgi:transglutaminase-like putative cysteine protease
MYQDLRTTLTTASADCDDFTIAFCALLRTVGFQCAARIISLNGTSWAHVYPLCYNPDRSGWIALDVTENGKLPGWEFSGARAVRDFPMGDSA